MISVGIEPPKTHNIMESIESNVLTSVKFPKKWKEDIKEITKSLLSELFRNRQISGYTFNYNINKKELESLSMKYLEKSKNAVLSCKKTIEDVDKP